MNTLHPDIMNPVFRVCLTVIGNQYALPRSIRTFLNPGGVDSKINSTKINNVTLLPKELRPGLETAQQGNSYQYNYSDTSMGSFQYY